MTSCDIRRRLGAAGLAGVLVLTVAPASGQAAAATFEAAGRLDQHLPDCGIQAVIDEAAAAGGGTVVLPAGRFPLARSLVLRSGVTLQGQGEATTLAAAVDEHRAMLAADCTADATTIELDGDLSTLAPGRMLDLWPRGRVTAGTITGTPSNESTATCSTSPGRSPSRPRPVRMPSGCTA
jgi:hypothetical protein